MSNDLGDLFFVELKDFPNYQINKLGWVIDKETRERIQELTLNGYRCVSLIDKDNRKCLRTIHRLLAIEFIPNNNPDRVIVNHIDGIKTNNALSNLEWCTYLENLEHAGRLGLTSKCFPILVRCTKTLSVTEYSSPRKAAKELGLSLTRDAVIWRLKSDGQKTWPEHKQYKRADSDTEWAEPELNPKEGRNQRMMLRSILTGFVRVFENKRSLADYLEIAEAVISQRHKAQRQFVVPNFFQVKADDGEPWTEFSDYYIELEKTLNGRCCVVWNDESVFIYTTCKEAAATHRLSVTALNYRLSLACAKLWKDGFRYAYYSDYLKILGRR